MNSLAQSFDSKTFQTTISTYCSQQQWSIADLNSERAILRFSMSSGRKQTCYIIRYDSTLAFSVPSGLAFDSTDKIPHFISTLLLGRSREKKVGFWCIEEIGGKQVFSCMYNAEMQLLNSKYFATVVRALIGECADFEEYFADL